MAVLGLVAAFAVFSLVYLRSSEGTRPWIWRGYLLAVAAETGIISGAARWIGSLTLPVI